MIWNLFHIPYILHTFKIWQHKTPIVSHLLQEIVLSFALPMTSYSPTLSKFQPRISSFDQFHCKKEYMHQNSNQTRFEIKKMQEYRASPACFSNGECSIISRGSFLHFISLRIYNSLKIFEKLHSIKALCHVFKCVAVKTFTTHSWPLSTTHSNCVSLLHGSTRNFFLHLKNTLRPCVSINFVFIPNLVKF